MLIGVYSWKFNQIYLILSTFAHLIIKLLKLYILNKLFLFKIVCTINIRQFLKSFRRTILLKIIIISENTVKLNKLFILKNTLKFIKRNYISVNRRQSISWNILLFGNYPVKCIKENLYQHQIIIISHSMVEINFEI
jgi:hypothetical protein